MLLSVIISTKYSDATQLESTLSHLLKNGFSEMEIIIVDQNEDERMRSVAKLFSDQKKLVTYISQRDSGLSKGRNLGYKFSIGEWLIFLDDDIVVSENFFTDIFLHLKKENKVSKIFFGQIFNKDDNKNYLRRFIKTKKLHYFNFDSVCSATLIFNRVVLEKIGLFDDRFGVGSEFGACEESDLILKALENHVAIVFEPSFIIFHGKNSFNSSKSYQYGKGLGALYRKHIFKKLFSFPILMIRMVLEWVIRILLVIRFWVKPNKNLRDYHISYLRGFYSGFKNYGNT